MSGQQWGEVTELPQRVFSVFSKYWNAMLWWGGVAGMQARVCRGVIKKSSMIVMSKFLCPRFLYDNSDPS